MKQMPTFLFTHSLRRTDESSLWLRLSSQACLSCAFSRDSAARAIMSDMVPGPKQPLPWRSSGAAHEQQAFQSARIDSFEKLVTKVWNLALYVCRM
jgi:hypothetical protein